MANSVYGTVVTQDYVGERRLKRTCSASEWSREVDDSLVIKHPPKGWWQR